MVFSLAPTFWVTLGEFVPPKQRSCGKSQAPKPIIFALFLPFFNTLNKSLILHASIPSVNTGRPRMLIVCAGDHQAFPGLPAAAIAWKVPGRHFHHCNGAIPVAAAQLCWPWLCQELSCLARLGRGCKVRQRCRTEALRLLQPLGSVHLSAHPGAVQQHRISFVLPNPKQQCFLKGSGAVAGLQQPAGSQGHWKGH